MRRWPFVSLVLIPVFLFALSCGGGGGENSTPVERLAFYTSTTGVGDMSSWVEVSGSGLMGLDAADSICRARADAAGLSGTFVAWLSDDSDDAYCRVHGLTGKKVDKCGQSTLPTSAGPWFRTDGKPFSAGIEDLTASGVIYNPVAADEFGSTSELYNIYWTGTDDNGVASNDNCSNWSDSTTGGLTIYMGATYGTVTRYTEGVYISWCSYDNPLLCLETGTGNVIPAPADTGQVVFITSVSGTGNLGSWSQAGGETGILAGDNICQEIASTAGLSNAGSFKAWLSDSSTDAADRITSDGPWVRLDGVQVAGSKSALVNSWLQTSIAVTEEGDYRWYGVWTGTLEGGTRSASACSDWTMGAGSTGESGDTSYNDSANWTAFLDLGCNNNYHLYCFED